MLEVAEHWFSTYDLSSEQIDLMKIESKKFRRTITHINLRNCCFSGEALQRVVSACPNLIVFDYDFNMEGWGRPFSVGRIRGALEPFESTLTEMSIYRNREDVIHLIHLITRSQLTRPQSNLGLDHLTPMHNLQSFKLLTRLDITAYLFFGVRRGDRYSELFDKEILKNRCFLCCRMAPYGQYYVDKDDEDDRHTGNCPTKRPLCHKPWGILGCGTALD